MPRCRAKNGKFVKQGEAKRRQVSSEWLKNLLIQRKQTSTNDNNVVTNVAKTSVSHNDRRPSSIETGSVNRDLPCRTITEDHNYSISESDIVDTQEYSLAQPASTNISYNNDFWGTGTGLPSSKLNLTCYDLRSTHSDRENSKQSKKLSWFSDGRRIIEPKYLTEQLQKGCEDCQQELNITRVVEETRSGLGSTLYVLCDCGNVNQLYTNKTHYDGTKKNRTRPFFDINTKAATGKPLVLSQFHLHIYLVFLFNTVTSTSMLIVLNYL